MYTVYSSDSGTIGTIMQTTKRSKDVHPILQLTCYLHCLASRLGSCEGYGNAKDWQLEPHILLCEISPKWVDAFFIFLHHLGCHHWLNIKIKIPLRFFKLFFVQTERHWVRGFMDLFPSKKKSRHSGFCRDKLALQVWSSSVPCWTSVDLQSGNAFAHWLCTSRSKSSAGGSPEHLQAYVTKHRRPCVSESGVQLGKISRLIKNDWMDFYGFLASFHPLNCLDLWLAEVLALCVEWEWKLRQQATWHKDAGFACNFGHATRPVNSTQSLWFGRYNVFGNQHWERVKAHPPVFHCQTVLPFMHKQFCFEDMPKILRRFFTILCVTVLIRVLLGWWDSLRRLGITDSLSELRLLCVSLRDIHLSALQLWNLRPTNAYKSSLHEIEVKNLKMRGCSFQFFSPKRCRSTTLQYLKLPGSHRRTLWSTWHACSSEALSICLYLISLPLWASQIFTHGVVFHERNLENTSNSWTYWQTIESYWIHQPTNPPTSHNIPF